MRTRDPFQTIKVNLTSFISQTTANRKLNFEIRQGGTCKLHSNLHCFTLDNDKCYFCSSGVHLFILFFSLIFFLLMSFFGEHRALLYFFNILEKIDTIYDSCSECYSSRPDVSLCFLILLCIELVQKH